MTAEEIIGETSAVASSGVGGATWRPPTSPPAHRGTRRSNGRRIGALAAGLSLVLGIGIALHAATRADNRQDLDAGPSATAPSRQAADPDLRTSGWHDLDPGPLSRRSRQSVVWAGDEFVVFGGESLSDGGGEPLRDGAAYDPDEGRWRSIAVSPLARPVFSVWTGSEIVAVERRPSVPTDAGPPKAAAYDPGTDAWRPLADPPPASTMPAFQGLIWTGTEILLLEALAAYDPATDRWRGLDSLSFEGSDGKVTFSGFPRDGSELGVAWTGESIVFAGYGSETFIHDPVQGSTRVLDGPPLHDVNVVGTLAAAVAIDDTVVLVDEEGRASALDLQTGIWRQEATPASPSGPCTPSGFRLDDGASIWDMCTSLWLRGTDGDWTREDFTAEAAPHVWGIPKASDGTVLFWWGNTDQPGYPTRRSTMAQIWAPPHD